MLVKNILILAEENNCTGNEMSQTERMVVCDTEERLHIKSLQLDHIAKTGF